MLPNILIKYYHNKRLSQEKSLRSIFIFHFLYYVTAPTSNLVVPIKIPNHSVQPIWVSLFPKTFLNKETLASCQFNKNSSGPEINSIPGQCWTKGGYLMNTVVWITSANLQIGSRMIWPARDKDIFVGRVVIGWENTVRADCLGLYQMLIKCILKNEMHWLSELMLCDAKLFVCYKIVQAFLYDC